MKNSKDHILTLKINEAELRFYKLKTIRGSLIFYDEESNFYASWDDLWHVLSNLSSEQNFHWTRLQPLLISRDFRRVILNNLNKHKKEIPIENMDQHMAHWDLWEKILFADETTIEIDISALNDKNIKVITVDYSSISDIESVFSLIKNYTKDSETSGDSVLFNLSTGNKIASSAKGLLSENQIMTGDLLKVELIR